MTAAARLVAGWNARRASRPALAEPFVNAPALVVGFYYRTDPATDSHQPWIFGQADLDSREDLADLECFAAKHLDANVLGQVLDLTGLSDEERDELARAATDGDVETLTRVLPRLPRMTTPGVDLDFDDAGHVAQLKEELNAYFETRGVVLRWSRSGGPSSAHEHGELGPAEPGAEHPELMRAAMGWFRDACRAIGLVPRADHAAAGDYWVEADDPTGERGSVDLSPVNRSPEARGSLFRPLGGQTKDRRARKVLSPGSPAEGSPWTLELVEEGLRLWLAQEAAAGRGAKGGRKQKVRAPLEDLPRASSLPELTAWVRGVARPAAHHDLRMALSGVLRLSGLVRPAWAIEAMAIGTGNRSDARDAWQSTDSRVRQGLPVKGGKRLREVVGVDGLEGLAWAVWSELHARGSRVSYGEVVHRIGLLRDLERRHVTAALEVIEGRLAAAPEAEDRERLETLHGRMGALARCGRRHCQAERCDDCRKFGAPVKLHCRMVDACPSCARRLMEQAEAVELPARLCLSVAVHASRKLAKADMRYARDYARRNGLTEPTCLDGPAPAGGWWALAFGPDEGRIGQDAKTGGLMPGASRIKDAPAALVRAWCARVLLSRHVQARARLERGDTAGFLDGALQLYRRKAVHAGKDAASIAWPSASGMKDWRAKRAEERARDAGEPAEPWCPGDCPLAAAPGKRRYRLLNEEGRPLIGGLKRRPTLVQAVALEDGAVDLPLGAQRLRL